MATQQDGEQQQDQHIGVHASSPFLFVTCPSAGLPTRRCDAPRSQPGKGLGTPFPSPFHPVKPSQPLCFHRTFFGHKDCRNPRNEWRR